MADLLSAVHFAAWQALVRRLDAAVLADSSLSTPRDVLTRPVELLSLIASDAPAALGDDVLRADRLRAYLYLTVPFASVVDQAERLLAAGDEGPGEWPPDGLPPVEPYQPGVLDLGALPVLAVAAARVGPPGMVGLFTRSLHGLALAASAAEVLGRLDPALPDQHAIEVVVHTLHLLESLGAALRMPYLRTFAFDPVERGRWRCLADLLDPQRLASIVAAAPWDGADAELIRRVEPRRALAAGQVALRGRFPFLVGDTVPAGVQVVFASADGAVQPARVIGVDSNPDQQQIRVEVPAAMGPAWIGFSFDDRIAATNAARPGVRERLIASYADDDCLVTTRVPAELVAPLSRPDPGRPGQLVSMPPRGAFNRFEGGVPLVTRATLEPRVAAPGAELTFTWESVGADEVRRLPAGTSLPPSGSLQLRAPASDGEVVVEIAPVATIEGKVVIGPAVTARASVVAPVRIRSVAVAQDGRAAPLWPGRPLVVTVALDPPTSAASGQLVLAPPCGQAGPLSPRSARVDGALVFDVPGPCVQGELALTAELLDPEGGVIDRATVGPLDLASPRDLTIVLFRPTVVEPLRPALESAAARARIDLACSARGVTPEVIELPWEGDELSVLAEAPATDDDPALPRLLEALARRAMVTPALEHALWLALLPDEVQADPGDPPPEDPPPEDPPPEDPPPIELRGATLLALASPLDGIAVIVPTAASWAVAVADTAGLARAIDQVLPPEQEPPILLLAARAAGPRTDGSSLAVAAGTRSPHLRLLARTAIDEIVAPDDLEVALDHRATGRGGAVATAWTVAALDVTGRDLAVHAVFAIHPQRPGYLEALVPASAEIAALELRRAGHLVARAVRPDGALEVGDVRLLADRPELVWDASHTTGLYPRITLAVRAVGVVTPVVDLHVCGGRDRVWLDRLGPADRLVLQASDGWTLRDVDIDADLPDHDRLALRRVSDGRWFAQAPDGWQLSWRLDGRLLDQSGALVALPADARGLLAVEARGPAGQVRTDGRRVEPDAAR